MTTNIYISVDKCLSAFRNGAVGSTEVVLPLLFVQHVLDHLFIFWLVHQVMHLYLFFLVPAPGALEIHNTIVNLSSQL